MTKTEIERVTAELDRLIDELERQVNRTLPKVLEQAYERVLELSSTVGNATSPEQIIQQGQQIANLRVQITNAITANPQYNVMLADIAATFARVAEVSSAYLSAAFIDIGINESLKQVLVNQATTEVIGLLTGAGVDSNFTAQVQNIIQTWITGQGNRASLNRLLRAAIKGTPERQARLARYVKQVSNDAIEQFNRKYIETMTADLDVGYWLYAGTVIKDSRPFCVARTGRVFTTKEVKSWASLSWSGKIPATDKATIISYLGGYNCRHRLLPVSKEVAERFLS